MMLRYSLDFRTDTYSRSTGAIENPAAPGQVRSQVTGVVRTEVLRVLPASSGGFESARLRFTYEKLSLSVTSDTPDAELAAAEAQFKRLEGRSIEYTLHADNRVTEVSGLEELLPQERAAVTQWLAQLPMSSGTPPDGVTPGQSWSAKPVAPHGSPLSGYVWKSESTYLRNEPCRLAFGESKAPLPGAALGLCAVILTRGMLTPDATTGDSTPEEFRRRELRTGGTMSGSSESLTYFSLATGVVVSVTQSGREESDIKISSTQGEVRMHYTVRTDTRSQVTLLP
jgi:hypothetical protein